MNSTSAAPPVPALYSRADVAQLLGLPLHELTWWIWALRPSRRYVSFEIARRHGGDPRLIHAPIKPIKDLQRRLADVLNSVYEPRVHVHGFVTGRSPYTNAQQHERQRWILKLDLDEFFPSIHFGRVRGMFMSHPFDYAPEVATILAQVCCHEGRLPQGAPTSPIVSNFICRGLDAALARLARAERCRFTRYADDICFSTNQARFPATLASLGPDKQVFLGDYLNALIASHGFTVSAEKTRLIRKTQRQRVTGLVVNRKTNVPADYVRSLRSLLYIWRQYGEADAAAAFARFEAGRNRPPAKAPAEFKQIVRGRVQYVGSIKGWSNEIYRSLAAALQQVDPSFRPRMLVSLSEIQRVRVYTEGESDPLHLLAAHRAFVAKGEFAHLELEVADDVFPRGDRALLAKCEELALEAQPAPCVCIFDRDSQDVIRRAVGSTPFRVRSDDVAAVVLSPPEWRDQRVCIEMLYRDEDVRRRDESGRRLYLAEEFNPRTGHHRDEQVHVPHPDGNKPDRRLVREEVFPYGSEDNVALSKLAFATYVADEASGFIDVDFEGFRRTFEVIEEAVVRLKARRERA